MKICFFGVGGVGGYFGTLVTKEFGNQHDIYFVGRGKHKEAILKNGLTLKKAGGNEIINVNPKICTENVQELPVCDLIVISVKSYDLANAVKDITSIVNDKTVILPLLNGVDIYERIRKHLTFGIVLPSCVYVGTHIESPGIIYQKGGSCKIHIGKDPQHSVFYPDSLLSLLKDSSIDFSWEEDINVAIWSKFMFIAAYGLVGAAYEKSLGEILENPEFCHKVKAIMTEIETISKKLNIPLDFDIVETSFLKAKQFPFEAKTSFQRDIELKGKVNESDLFGGTVIKYGELLGVSTSNTQTVFNTLMNRWK